MSLFEARVSVGHIGMVAFTLGMVVLVVVILAAYQRNIGRPDMHNWVD